MFLIKLILGNFIFLLLLWIEYFPHYVSSLPLSSWGEIWVFIFLCRLCLVYNYPPRLNYLTNSNSISVSFLYFFFYIDTYIACKERLTGLSFPSKVGSPYLFFLPYCISLEFRTHEIVTGIEIQQIFRGSSGASSDPVLLSLGTPRALSTPLWSVRHLLWINPCWVLEIRCVSIGEVLAQNFPASVVCLSFVSALQSPRAPSFLHIATLSAGKGT